MVSISVGAFKSQAIILNPADMNLRATASPMPDVAPVIRTWLGFEVTILSNSASNFGTLNNYRIRNNAWSR